MNGARVIVSGPKEDAGAFAARLHSIGFDAVAVATIRIIKKKLSAASIAALRDIASYDYLLFTSARAVEFFAAAIHEIGVKKIPKIKVIAIGPATARACREAGFIPRMGTMRISGKKVLFPCSSIARAETTERLEEKGAIVTKVPLYSTTVLSDTAMVHTTFSQHVDFILFMSPSSVEGFVKNLAGTILDEQARMTQVVAIGPTTAAAARASGFTKIAIAGQSTTDGIVKTLKRLSSS